ncbi:hypothetical protein ACFX2I_023422 [Malus domestica]
MRESAKEIESEKTQEENKKMEEKKKRMKERMMPPAPKPKTRTGGEKDASSHQVVQVMATLKLNQHHQEVGGSRTGRELDINRCSGDRGENERHVGYLAEKSLYYSFRSPSPSSLASAFNSRRGLHRQAEQVPEEGQSLVERESPSC